jgi:hypothetical protein
MTNAAPRTHHAVETELGSAGGRRLDRNRRSANEQRAQRASASRRIGGIGLWVRAVRVRQWPKTCPRSDPQRRRQHDPGGDRGRADGESPRPGDRTGGDVARRNAMHIERVFSPTS